jgi:hypothetical protein
VPDDGGRETAEELRAHLPERKEEVGRPWPGFGLETLNPHPKPQASKHPKPPAPQHPNTPHPKPVA